MQLAYEVATKNMKKAAVINETIDEAVNLPDQEGSPVESEEEVLRDLQGGQEQKEGSLEEVKLAT